MSNFRPAGLSDEESGSDDDFYEPRIKYHPPPQNAIKKIENTLQDAIINSNVNVVEDIIDNELKGDVNIHLDSGWTPLMHACFHAQENIVRLLLDKGADPNLNSDQVTPVMVACSNSGANDDTIDNIVTYLIQKDCLLNLGDKYGQTPLMRAIGSGRVVLVQKLLDMNVNIEMRDKQGWTAVFWAVHHNRPHILEMLISRGARLLEVDNSNRNVMEIAHSHDYANIIEILKQHIEEEDDKDAYFDHTMTSWHDFYPGVTKRGKPSYTNEIPHLLYGMSCEKLGGIIQHSGIDLKTFLLLEEKDMIKLGIDLPFQRQRLITGLHNFHRRAWKLKSVAGLTASKAVNFTAVDGLTSLGSHLQQVYILEATLQYVMREYCRTYQGEKKSKPPDSELVQAATKMYTIIKKNKKQLKRMGLKLAKISKNNPQPADLLKEKSYHDIAKNYMTEAFIVCSLGFLVYQTKNYFTSILTK